MNAKMSKHATISSEIRQTLEQSSVPNLANRLLRRGFRNVVPHGIAPIGVSQPNLVGPAYTLRFIPAREDLDSMENYALETNLHRIAVEECPAGAVLVIDAFDCTEASAMGDMMAHRLKYNNVAGVITNGGYRDVAGILETGLPCFHRQAAAPATPIKLHPVSINEPVGIGGVAVYPGDIVVGDNSGLVVIPQDLVLDITREAAHDIEYESWAAEQIDQVRTLFEVFPSTPDSRRDFDQYKKNNSTY